VDSLLAIATKAPIVSTFGAEALHSSPSDVRDAYDWHAASYVEQPPLADLRRSFIDAVREHKTPKACLVAPFGYGKTASAIGIWRACQGARLLAVPPVSCGSFTEVARAINDWLTFVLPNHQDEIMAAHDQFLAGSATALARRDEREFGIPFDQGLASITDKLERGYLDFDDVSVNLIAFLEHMTLLVRRAGFDGLILIIDEMQQLLGNASKGVLVALRQLIWGLRTRQLPLGLLLTMDPDTERTLADRAGDILHRIKDDGLYLDIRHVYDRSFPARLWHQYTEAFELDGEARAAIDGHALEALGQLCERDDLSNGPRTVINVLQIAASRWHDRHTHYTSVDVVDDLIDGTVRFDGDRAVLTALVAELLNFPYFQRSPERARTLKLLAAFPRGCPETVAAVYGLDSAWREIGDDLRGEIVIERDEGLALVELQRVGRPANYLNVLLRRYWMQITDQQLFAEDAPQAFAQLVLPLLFPQKVHDLSGWSGVYDIDLTPTGGYAGVVEGTSSTSFPLRRIAVAVIVVGTEVPVVRGMADVDFHIVFRLDLDRRHGSTVRVSETGLIEFTLSIAQTVTGGLRGGLSWIEHYLSPQPISPAVILSLLRFVARENADNGGERDQGRIEDTTARLQAWLLAELLPREMFASDGVDVIQVGQGAFQEFLYLCAVGRWPQYHPLARHQHWVTLMGDYLHALGRVSPASRVGVTPVKATKAEVATYFEQKRHSGFESRARQYGDLLKVDVWRGDEAAIRFIPHPMELKLADDLRTAGPQLQHDVYRRLRLVGYAAPEADMLLDVARARGLIVEKAGALEAPDIPAGVEVIARARDLRERCATLPDGPEEFLAQLTSIIRDVESGHQVNLTEATWQLDRIEQWATHTEAAAHAAMAMRGKDARARLLNVLARLTPLSPPSPSGYLTNHLVALQDRLDKERRGLQQMAEGVIATPEAISADDAEAASRSIEDWHTQAELYERWRRMAASLARLQATIGRLGSRGVPNSAAARVTQLNHETRALLAQIGVAGLTEISRFEVSLASIEQDFAAAQDQRTETFSHIAADLHAHISTFVDLPTSFAAPAYDIADDDKSFTTLYRTIAAATSRSIALLGIEIGEMGGTTQEKLARAKLRSDIRSLAHRAADYTWLLSVPAHRLRPEAANAISMLRKRVARIANATGQIPLAGPHLIRALSALPPGAVDISTLFDKIKEASSRLEVLADLVRLQEAGSIRLVIDVSIMEDADES